MPFWGLILTSTGFALPAWIAWRKQKKLDAVASTALAISSILFHSTLHPTIKIVDTVIAHGVGAISLGRCLVNAVRSPRRAKDIAGVLTTPLCAIIFYHFSKGRESIAGHVGHMGLHVAAIGYWVFYLV